MSAEIALVLRSEEDIQSLAAAVDELADAHALTPQAVTALNLVLEELVTSAFMDGVGPEAGTVQVRATADGDSVHGEVRDDGRPFDPLSRGSPEVELALEDREIGGLGIPMVRSMARDLSYAREGEENVMRFALDVGTA